MAKVRVHTNGKLFFDFRFQGRRYREYTALADTARNRRLAESVIRKIDRAIKDGSFRYQDFFPPENSRTVSRPIASATSDAASAEEHRALPGATPCVATPGFSEFFEQWYMEREIGWKRSYQQKVADIGNKHLIPAFRAMKIGDISKAECLAFRASLAKDKGLSPSRINAIMNILRQVLSEAAERFDYTMPIRDLKPLRQPRSTVNPLSLAGVQAFLSAVPERHRPYYVTAFFTGLRTSELNGLKWKYVDLERRQIGVFETFVYGKQDTTKTDGSQRYVEMSSPVVEALSRQQDLTRGRSDYVFCSRNGQPLNYRNMARRVWYPTLEKAGLERRRPYQTRHTAATLWLAAGESPEWIARQMGHATTKMLFSVYSRYVPNVTHSDGSAMERLLATQFADSNTGHCKGDES